MPSKCWHDEWTRIQMMKKNWRECFPFAMNQHRAIALRTNCCFFFVPTKSQLNSQITFTLFFKCTCATSSAITTTKKQKPVNECGKWNNFLKELEVSVEFWVLHGEHASVFNWCRFFALLNKKKKYIFASKTKIQRDFDR